MSSPADGAALDFDTNDNLLSLREAKRRAKYLNSKALLEEKVRKAREEFEKHGFKIPKIKKLELKYANQLPDHDDIGNFKTEEEKRKEELLKRLGVVRIKSVKVEKEEVDPHAVKEQKLKKKDVFLYKHAFSFSKGARHAFGKKLGQKERNHQIEDEYRLAKVRKKYAVPYDKMKGRPVLSKNAGSVLHKKQLPFGSGFAASFGSTPKTGFTAAELLNGPSASDYKVRQGKFGDSKGEFTLFFSWDDIRDTDWTTLGGRFDLRLQMQSDEAKERQRQRKAKREQKLRGAAVLQARKEFEEILAIEERMNRRHGRTPRRTIDKRSMMQFKYIDKSNGEMKTTVGENPPTKLQMDTMEQQRKDNEEFLAMMEEKKRRYRHARVAPSPIVVNKSRGAFS